MSKWDKRFMDMAKMVATWSKDKGTGVGAVIVDDDKKVVSLGYNGFPRGINDDVACRHDSPEKHHWTIHAERSAILEADIPLKGMTLYCTFFTCSICAQEITQKGFKRVVAPEPDWNHPRYGEGQKIALEMYKEKGIEVTFYKEPKDTLIAFWEIGCGGGKVHDVITVDRFSSYIDKYKKNKLDQGIKITRHNINDKLGVIEFFVGRKEKLYLHYGNYEVNDFIFKR
jgi:dCMP deaminase